MNALDNASIAWLSLIRLLRAISNVGLGASHCQAR